MTRPLEGIRILDFTHVLAGPFVTRILGDMGADVADVVGGYHLVAFVLSSEPNPFLFYFSQVKTDFFFILG